MKPTVPETGTVIGLRAGSADILMKGGHACKGCGAGEIGLCRAGSTSMVLTAENRLGARVGDTVQVGLSSRVRWKGYLLAYLIPLLSLLGGAVAGHLVAQLSSRPLLDVASALAALVVSSAFSFRRLRRLDASYSMEVTRILDDGVFIERTESDEERAFSRLSCRVPPAQLRG